MGTPKELILGQQRPMTAESLLEAGAIEALVRVGRAPGIIECLEDAFAVIPPEGTQFENMIVHGMGAGGFGDQGLVIFESAGGKQATADLVNITLEQARLIKVRREAELDRMGVKNRPLYRSAHSA